MGEANSPRENRLGGRKGQSPLLRPILNKVSLAYQANYELLQRSSDSGRFCARMVWSSKQEDKAVGAAVSRLRCDAIFHLVCSPSVIFCNGRISIN